MTFRSSPVPGSHLLGRHLQPTQIGTQGLGLPLAHFPEITVWVYDVEFLWPVCYLDAILGLNLLHETM